MIKIIFNDDPFLKISKEQKIQMKSENIIYSTPELNNEYLKNKTLSRKFWYNPVDDTNYEIIDSANNQFLNIERRRRRNLIKRNHIQKIYNLANVSHKMNDINNELIETEQENNELNEQVITKLKEELKFVMENDLGSSLVRNEIKEPINNLIVNQENKLIVNQDLRNEIDINEIDLGSSLVRNERNVKLIEIENVKLLEIENKLVKEELKQLKEEYELYKIEASNKYETLKTEYDLYKVESKNKIEEIKNNVNVMIKN